MRTITWNIWFERNVCIFTSTCLSTDSIIMKIDCMLLLWLIVAPNLKKVKLEELMSKIKRSLEFLTTTEAVPNEHWCALSLRERASPF